MSDLNIDLDEVEDFLPLPKGTYKLAAEHWEKKESKNNNTYISVQYTVMEPVDYENRKLWENFTLSQNFAVVRIKRWVKATGQTPEILNEDQMDQLMDKPFYAVVGIEKELYPYPPQNRIIDFLIPEDLDDSDKSASQDNSKSSDPVSVESYENFQARMKQESENGFDDELPF